MRRQLGRPKRRRVGFREAAKKGLVLLVPLATLAYALAAWRTSNRRGGAIASASRGGCFGPKDTRARRYRGGGEAATGEGDVLKNIAGVYRQRERLVGGRCGGRKAVAFAITLTKDGNHMDGAAVLAASIDNACASSEFLCDLVAFLHDDVGVQSENVLRRLGFRVLRPGLPLSLDDIRDKTTRTRVEKGGCCGAAELMKLFAYTLTEYHRVVHLDTDVLVLRPLDPLLDAEESLLYTADINMSNKYSTTMPVQGGFLVVRPDVAVFEDLMEVVKNTPYSPSKGWGGSMIGLFWGGITVQGLLPYYYQHRAPPEITYRAVDRCVYNNMVDMPACQAIDVKLIRSVHFTNCQKPWECYYPHPKQPLCSRLMERWFEVRAQVEEALGLPPSKACRAFYKDYSPMPLVPDTS